MTNVARPIPGVTLPEIVAVGVGDDQHATPLASGAEVAGAVCYKITLVRTDGGDYAGRDIDKRQGNFITIVQPAPLPAIEALDHVRQPPRPLRDFLDREEQQHVLRPELRPRGGAWLHGPGGCGSSALLNQAANLPTA